MKPSGALQTNRNEQKLLHTIASSSFKKKLFRESDEAVTDLMFVQLSYVQVSIFFIGDIYFHTKGLPFVADTHICSCNMTIC